MPTKTTTSWQEVNKYLAFLQGEEVSFNSKHLTCSAMDPVRQPRETLDPRLYNALRSRIIKNRLAATDRVDCLNLEEVHIPPNLEKVTKCIKEAINCLDYLRKVKRGMLLHLEWLQEKHDEGVDETRKRSQEDQSNSESSLPTGSCTPPSRIAKAPRKRFRRLSRRKRGGGKIVKKQPPRACKSPQ
ncbi:Hypothetical protein NTJ_04923 [Nesidiocoris tenuis]|uniref:Uncharacterized protein n=1 Tax=Nesidiocoris tenuis TaxID=355587 RepID=A0ABN7ALL1_9HEMI|nr:Hypothetical protein NTJ_04923 [Nesidiocoris tenuis]